MHLDAPTAERFRASVARLEPRFDDVAQRFFERLSQACPHAMRVVPTWNKRNRFELHAAFTEVVKHIENPGARLARMRGAFMAVGLTEQDFRTIQQTLIATVKEDLGAAWNQQTESDWAAVLHSIFSTMRASAQPPKVRGAA